MAAFFRVSSRAGVMVCLAARAAVTSHSKYALSGKKGIHK